jgi:hypothetical protein
VLEATNPSSAGGTQYSCTILIKAQSYSKYLSGQFKFNITAEAALKKMEVTSAIVTDYDKKFPILIFKTEDKNNVDAAAFSSFIQDYNIVIKKNIASLIADNLNRFHN